MSTFGRTESGKWHVIGPDGCRYGQAYTDDTPEETVAATDIVAYDPPIPNNRVHEWEAPADASRGYDASHVPDVSKNVMVPSPSVSGNPRPSL